ncbi:hypothetical protein COLO4_36361 [Corchorus olitorius]|uniref:G-patch domain-containing protein n=1 Tax=Corchorus olitorius TaxID=93759 RepID=A0A1R3G9C6_9ROSI|nr:hypothetical protein COLO4_36361 [Corchorus olitorius]
MQMMKRYGWTEGFEATTVDHQILADNREMSKGERTGLPFNKETKMEIPPLSQTFRSVGWPNEKRRQSVEEIEMVTEKVSEHIICATMEETIEPYPWIRELAQERF